MARKKLKRGGLTNGKSHAKGGVPMTVKSTGQKVELEGGEGVINKYVMADKEKYSFEGRNMTACEVASELNQETGNGVAFDCEETNTTDMTPTDASTGFAKGGKTDTLNLPTKKEVDEMYRHQSLNPNSDLQKEIKQDHSDSLFIRTSKGEYSISYINEDGKFDVWSDEGAKFGGKGNNWSNVKKKFKELKNQNLEVKSINQSVWVYAGDDGSTIWDADNRYDFSFPIWTSNNERKYDDYDKIYYVEVIKDREKYRLGEIDVELVEKDLTEKQALELSNQINQSNPNWVVFVETKNSFAKGGKTPKYTYDYFKAVDEGLDPQVIGKYVIERNDGAMLSANRKTDVSFIIKNEELFEEYFDSSIYEENYDGDVVKLDSVRDIRVIEDFDVDELRNKLAKGGDISEKVVILKEEGYPQNQAVAIAHSMKERGEFAKGGQIFFNSRSSDAVELSQKVFDALPPYYEKEGTAIYRNLSAKPAYGELKYADIGNIQRTTIDGKELAIAKQLHSGEYRFIEETFQLKKFPTVKVEWNGINYNVGKEKKSRYGSSVSLGDYVWYAPIVDKVLKGIASPLFITKYKGYSTDWNIVDGWSGVVGGVETYKVSDGYSSRNKSTIVNDAMSDLHKLISFGFGLPVITDILKKYNISDELIDTWAVGQQYQSLIIDAEAAEGRANVADNYGHWKAFKEDKNLYDITLSPDATRIYQTIPAINPQFAAFAALDAETYVKLTNEVVDVLMSKDFADRLVMAYNIATIASLLLNSNGILSPSYTFNDKPIVTKKKGGRFNRNDSFDNSPQNKDIARLQNLMALYHDTPSALKEMNEAIRGLEKEMEVDLNLEGKKNFNLDKAFSGYFNIVGKGYTGKRGKRTKALAPSGGQSELNTKQYDIIRTSNFKQWFGDWDKAYETKNYNGVSKVVDSDGEPKVVYHGTMPPSDFTEFKFDTFPVMYFSEDELYAEFFSKKTAPQNPSIMFEFFLNIRNPLEMVDFGVDDITVNDLKFILWEKHGIKLDVSKVPKKGLHLPTPFWAIIRNYKKFGLHTMFDTIKKYGYDGIHYVENNPKWIYDGKEAVTIGWMMFTKDRAKLADGRNTTFSSFKDDFRFNKGGDVTE